MRLIFFTILFLSGSLVSAIALNTPIHSHDGGCSDHCMRPMPIDDLSQAGSDGPHVFYRHGKIVVKQVVMFDTTPKFSERIFDEKKEVTLQCQVPETGDKFSFQLQTKLRPMPDVYDLPQKMLVLSDIEGNFGAFKTLLCAGGVIDKQFNWTYGDGHLVLTGDFFDRGLNVTECLWLVYKLEREAETFGGKVHFILGNHEVMNMNGDHRYVRNKYFENAKLLSESYGDLFTADTELGKWLRTKNGIEKIGSYVFCHGGVSPQLMQSGLTIQAINEITRSHLGIKAQEVSDSEAKAVFDAKTGVFWYRDLAKNKVADQAVTEILAQLGAKALVIGHTLVNDVTLLYGGKVICNDLFHEENYRSGTLRTLVIEQDVLYSMDQKGVKTRL